MFHNERIQGSSFLIMLFMDLNKVCMHDNEVLSLAYYLQLHFLQRRSHYIVEEHIYGDVMLISYIDDILLTKNETCIYTIKAYLHQHLRDGRLLCFELLHGILFGFQLCKLILFHGKHTLNIFP